MLYYFTTTTFNDDWNKDSLNINNFYIYENNNILAGDNNINNMNIEAQLNQENSLEDKNITNIQKESNINIYSDSHHKLNDYNNLAYVESTEEEFKPYVSKHPEKVFKKRGMACNNNKSHIKDENNYKKENKNKNIIYISISENDKNINKNKKSENNSDNLNEIDNTNNTNAFYCEEANNNVFFEIKEFNEGDKYLNNMNIKEKDISNKNVINKTGTNSKKGIYNIFGVQSEELYIPKAI